MKDFAETERKSLINAHNYWDIAEKRLRLKSPIKTVLLEFCGAALIFVVGLFILAQ